MSVVKRDDESNGAISSLMGDVPLDPPDGLSSEAKKIWKSTVEELTTCGVVGRVDTLAVVQFCEVCVVWQTARDLVRKQGLVSAKKVNPALNVMNQAHDRILRMLAGFGMTPKSRGALKIAKNKIPHGTGASTTPNRFARIAGKA